MHLPILTGAPIFSAEWFNQIISLIFTLGANQLLGMGSAIAFLIPLLGPERLINSDNFLMNFIIICIFGALVNYAFTINNIILNTTIIGATLVLAFFLGFGVKKLLSEL